MTEQPFLDESFVEVDESLDSLPLLLSFFDELPQNFFSKGLATSRLTHVEKSSILSQSWTCYAPKGLRMPENQVQKACMLNTCNEEKILRTTALGGGGCEPELGRFGPSRRSFRRFLHFPSFLRLVSLLIIQIGI